MKLKIDLVERQDLDDIEVTISCKEKNSDVEKIMSMLLSLRTQIIGKLDGENHLLDLDTIYYFESVDNRVFAYCHKQIYEINYKIQELLIILNDTNFIQINRTTILNIEQIRRIRTIINGRLKVVLANDEEIIITRVYSNSFKAKLKEQVKK